MNWAEKINELSSGYKDSAVLLTAVRLRLFDALGPTGATAAATAAALDLDERALDVVLCALAARGLLRRDGDRFVPEPGVLPYLAAESPDTMVSILGHNLTMMRKWVRLEEVVRSGRPVPRGERTDQELQDFIRGMENVSRQSSRDVAERFDFTGVHRLLDLGGGPGTAAIIFARAHPALECVVFDLPRPLLIAQEQIRAAGLADRVTTCAGDYHADDFGTDFDVVYISNIIHSMGPAETLDLYRKSHAALNSGGRVIVKDFFLADSRCEPVSSALFSVNMLVGTERGKSYTRTETKELLAEVGFGSFTVTDVAQASQLIVGRRES